MPSRHKDKVVWQRSGLSDLLQPMSFLSRVPIYLWVALGLSAALIGVILWGVHSSYSDSAKFWINCFSAVGVITAVFAALFGDAMKANVDRIRVGIRDTEISNGGFDQHPDHGTVYLHHLRVINATPHRPIINCRVWLERIQDEVSPDMFSEPLRFAVPRLMSWSPGEYSGDKRTFADQQVFDFGMVRNDDGRFILSANCFQGGYFHNRGDCASEKCRRYFFRVTADNFVSDELFGVEVRPYVSAIGKSTGTKVNILTSAEVRKSLFAVCQCEN